MAPARNLWHCFGCGIGGGPIDWVMKKRGVSFRRAVELRVKRLNFWRGFSYSFGDNDGEASLTRVQRERGTFDVPLALEKRQGRWSVASAKTVSEKGETVVIVE